MTLRHPVTLVYSVCGLSCSVYIYAMVFGMYMYTLCRYVQWSCMQCVYMCDDLSYVQVYTVYISFVSTPIYLSCSHRASAGWRRLIGSLKLQIIFHKRATKYRSLLRKITHKDKASYDSTPPCNSVYIHVYRVYVSCIYIYVCIYGYREVGGWGRDPK